LRSPTGSPQERAVCSVLPTRCTVSGRSETGLPALSSPDQPLPHKIFVWDPNGHYLDASYPNPLYGHFLTPTRLKGTRVTDLFSRVVSARLLHKIREAWKTGNRQFTVVPLEREGQRYEARVFCVPTQEGHIVGMVTDRLVGASRVALVSSMSGQRGGADLFLAGQWVTLRQYGIAQKALEGWTNLEIARHLDITERTVKSHLSKIYRKLGVVNRYGLLASLIQERQLIPAASLRPSESILPPLRF